MRMKKKQNRIIEALLGLLPVSRRAYKKDLRNILVILQGIKQAEIQHSQVESNLLRTVSGMQTPKSQSSKDDNDVAFS